MAPQPGPQSAKFGMPVYCAAFLNEELLVLGGGGGHGIPNRLAVVHWANNSRLQPEPLCTVSTCSEPPQRLALHPDRSTLVVAFSTKLQIFRARVTTAADGAAACELVAQDTPPSLAKLSDTKCLVFSTDGTRLALGADDGRLRVMTWPKLECIADVAGAHPDALSDADFSPDGSLLVTTGNERVTSSGGACVWRVLPDGLERLTWLSGCGAPAGSRVTYRGVKFTRAGGRSRVFVGANVSGEARVAVWRVDDWRLVACKRALREPLTSLALSPPSGRLVAAGGADGSVVALASGTLAAMTRVPNAHMVFVTSVAFSPSGSTLASVSGDASVRCTPMPPPKSTLFAALRMLLVLAMLTLVTSIALRARRSAL